MEKEAAKKRIKYHVMFALSLALASFFGIVVYPTDLFGIVWFTAGNLLVIALLVGYERTARKKDKQREAAYEKDRERTQI